MWSSRVSWSVQTNWHSSQTKSDPFDFFFPTVKEASLRFLEDAGNKPLLGSVFFTRAIFLSETMIHRQISAIILLSVSVTLIIYKLSTITEEKRWQWIDNVHVCTKHAKMALPPGLWLRRTHTWAVLLAARWHCHQGNAALLSALHRVCASQLKSVLGVSIHGVKFTVYTLQVVSSWWFINLEVFNLLYLQPAGFLCKVSIDPLRHGSSPHMDWHLSCPAKLAPLLCLLGLNFGAQKQTVREKICASAHTPTDKFRLISALNDFHSDLCIDSFLLSGFFSARKKLKKAAKFLRIDLSLYAENEIIEVDISSDSDEPHVVPRHRLLHSSISAIDQICNLSSEVNYIYSFQSSSNLKSLPDSAMKSPPFKAQKTLRVNLEAPAKENNSSSQEFSTELNASILLNIKCISEECDHHFESQELRNEHFLGDHKMPPFRCILKDCGKAFPLS